MKIIVILWISWSKILYKDIDELITIIHVKHLYRKHCHTNNICMALKIYLWAGMENAFIDNVEKGKYFW